MPGNIVFRWYDRAQADEVYRAWTVEQLAKRLEEAKTSTGEPPLGKPGVATTESLERLLHDWHAQGRAVQRICEIEAERPADCLLRYELLCDACTQSEWRAKEAFFLRHLLGLGSPAEPERSSETGARPETGAAVKAPDARTAPLHTGAAQADLETTYSASREGRFSWREWPLLTDALKPLEWNRWVAAFRASYEADKATRRGGVEQALRQNYQAFDELRQRLKEGDERGWALVVYEANDERLPFPPPTMLADAARQTAASVDEARRLAEATLARRRRLQRIVVPVILIVVFWLLGFLFTQSLLGAAIVAAVIALIISVVVYAIIRRPT